MPCNAIATARAKIENETLLKVVDEKTIEQVAKATCSKLPKAKITNERILRSPQGFEIFRCSVGFSLGKKQYTANIYMQSNGEIIVTYAGFPPANFDLAVALQNNLQTVAANKLAIIIGKQLKSQGAAIKGATVSNTGTSIIDFEV